MLLAILIARTNVAEVIQTISRLGMPTWFFNLTLFVAAWSIATLKWKVLLPQHSVLTLFRLNFIGQFYSVLLPGQLAGEIIKALKLGRGKRDAEQVAASVIIDRITGFLGLLAVAVSGMILSERAVDFRVISTFGIFIVLLLFGLFCLRFPRWFKFLQSWMTRCGPLGPPASRVLYAWKKYSAQPSLLLVSTSLGACFQITAIFINLQFARKIGIDISFADWSWIFAIVSIATMLPFSVGGIGLREGSFVGALALLDVPAEQALALSFAAFSLILAGAAAGGVLDWTQKREGRGPVFSATG